MNRRKFLKQSALAAGALPFSLHGINLSPHHLGGLLEMLAMASTNDKVIVLINMLGGNDGLNTIIPANSTQYNQYAAWRPQISIPYNQLLVPQGLPNNTSIGFHPAMTGFYNLFIQDKLAVVQNVSYPNINQSHFRSRDIWLSGSDSDEYWSSGWMGRYLHTVEWTSADPIAIEVSAAASLSLYDTMLHYHGFNVEDPEAFYNLVNGFPVNNGNNLPVGYMADEIEYILGVEQATNAFANQLHQRYTDGGPSSVIYPGTYTSNNGFIAGGYLAQNYLGNQLQIVAQLIRGGCDTKVYLCNINGFDTHAAQVYGNGLQSFRGDGHHAALLYYLSGSIEAFLSDLGIYPDKALVFTMSEFGRRVYNNSSTGTDHGDANPMFIAGNCVIPGVYNDNADLSTQAVNGNGGSVNHMSDFRHIFSTLLIDWFACEPQIVEGAITNDGVGWGDDDNGNGLGDITENRIHFVEPACMIDPLGAPSAVVQELSIFPNPATNQVQISWPDTEGIMHLQVYDASGRVVWNEFYPSGTPAIIAISGWAPGMYICEAGIDGQTRKQKFIKQ